MPDSSGVSGRSSGGSSFDSSGRGPSYSIVPDRNNPIGTSRTNVVPHGVAVVGSRTHQPSGVDPVYYWHPWGIFPNSAFWGRRDIMGEIQFMARGGFVPCTRMADDASEVSDYADFPSGWKGYAFVVPANGTLHVKLDHVNRGWFRLVMMNKWGDLEAGMLKNLIPTGNPEVTYTNPSNEIKAVYIIADDPGWMSSKAYPYRLTVERSWDPASVDLKNVKVAVGVWGGHQDISAQFRRPTWVGFGSWDRRGRGWW